MSDAWCGCQLPRQSRSLPSLKAETQNLWAPKTQELNSE
jgi:hypothetical protein